MHVGIGIFFKNKEVLQLSEPVKLDILKKQRFFPPQGFRYTTENEAAWFNEISAMSV